MRKQIGSFGICARVLSRHNDSNLDVEKVLRPLLSNHLSQLIGPPKWFWRMLFLCKFDQNHEPWFLSFVDRADGQIYIAQPMAGRHVEFDDFANQSKFWYSVLFVMLLLLFFHAA